MIGAALHTKAAVGVDGLWLETEVAHDGDAALDEALDDVLVAIDAFEFDCVCAGLDKTPAVFDAMYSASNSLLEFRRWAEVCPAPAMKPCSCVA